MNKTKIIMIDGYAGAGKSTCLGIINNILGEDFNCIKKYTTRQPRIEEKNKSVFYESVFLTESEFTKRKLDFVVRIEGVYYGVDKNEILFLLNRKYAFMIANEYLRSQMYYTYGQLADIKQIFIKTTYRKRVERIQKANLGLEQENLRLRRLNANIIRKENEFDFVINNDLSIDSLEKQITDLILNKI